MKVLVFAHHLELGGTQVNAIELAERVATRFGHDVVLFATPGPAAELAQERGVRLLEAPRVEHHPSLAMVRALRRAVRDERPDLIHVWDWPQLLDAYYGTHLDRRIPIACTAMGMTVPRLLPRNVPTTFGTPALHAEAQADRPTTAHLLEPPVDLERNRPGAVDGPGFRAAHGVADDEILVTIISRLTSWMKLEGLERLIQATADLAADAPLKLVIVGEGPSADRLAALADDVNRRVGRDVVVLAGPMTDPRPAYDAADVVVGMGSSGLRAMAFAKPLLILGEAGFSDIFEPSTADWFLWNGIYGIGDGDLDHAPVREQLGQLVGSASRRDELGAFSLETVTRRYGLDMAADQLELVYQVAQNREPSFGVVLRDGLRTAGLRWGAGAIPDPMKNAARKLRRAA